jgi:hypothetical protein
VAYSDFDLTSVSERFDLTVIGGKDLFSATPEAAPGEWLRQVLTEWAPIAQATNTEKARSEWIISPVLMEAVRLSGHRLSLFSGITFDVDREKGLNGSCDFLLARSPEQFFLKRPVVAVVEAKREDLLEGMGQCVAALVGARVFNQRQKGNEVPAFLGAVTSGSDWRFVKLEGNTVVIDRPEYNLPQVGKILGILVGMAA